MRCFLEIDTQPNFVDQAGTVEQFTGTGIVLPADADAVTAWLAEHLSDSAGRQA